MVSYRKKIVKEGVCMSQERKFDAEQMTELLDSHDYKKMKEELESVNPVDSVDAL